MKEQIISSCSSNFSFLFVSHSTHHPSYSTDASTSCPLSYSTLSWRKFPTIKYKRPQLKNQEYTFANEIKLILRKFEVKSEVSIFAMFNNLNIYIYLCIRQTYKEVVKMRRNKILHLRQGNLMWIHCFTFYRRV